MATTHSPTRTRGASASLSTLRPLASILTRARSEPGSLPITLPSKARPSLRVTLMVEAPWVTWWLVRTRPEASITKPEPTPFCSKYWGRRLRSEPKKRWKKGSIWAMGFFWRRTVSMLTTAGAAFSARSAMVSGPKAATARAAGAAFAPSERVASRTVAAKSRFGIEVSFWTAKIGRPVVWPWKRLLYRPPPSPPISRRADTGE
ncbi:hypothetical protein D3C86_1094690 [compost metagenome]